VNEGESFDPITRAIFERKVKNYPEGNHQTGGKATLPPPEAKELTLRSALLIQFHQDSLHVARRACNRRWRDRSIEGSGGPGYCVGSRRAAGGKSGLRGWRTDPGSDLISIVV